MKIILGFKNEIWCTFFGFIAPMVMVMMVMLTWMMKWFNVINIFFRLIIIGCVTAGFPLPFCTALYVQNK